MRTPRAAGLELTAALLLLAGGAALALWAGGQAWAAAVVHRPGIVTAQLLALSGSDVAGAAGALGYAVLSATAVVLITRRRVRALTGVVAAVLGALIVVTSALGVADVAGTVAVTASLASGSGSVDTTVHGWWVVSLAGGALALVGGALTAWRGSGWPAMGARYDGPQPARGRPERPPASAWEALDRGEDPTA